MNNSETSVQVALEEANSKLVQWDYMFGPVLDFAQNNSEALGIRIGESISKYVLNMLVEKVAQNPHSRS